MKRWRVRAFISKTVWWEWTEADAVQAEQRLANLSTHGFQVKSPRKTTRYMPCSIQKIEIIPPSKAEIAG